MLRHGARSDFGEPDPSEDAVKLLEGEEEVDRNRLNDLGEVDST